MLAKLIDQKYQTTLIDLVDDTDALVQTGKGFDIRDQIKDPKRVYIIDEIQLANHNILIDSISSHLRQGGKAIFFSQNIINVDVLFDDKHGCRNSHHVKWHVLAYDGLTEAAKSDYLASAIYKVRPDRIYV